MPRLILVLSASLSLLVSPAYADVQLSIHDGLVSLDAQGATLRQILAEWARVGQTRIVNGERVPGGPISLQLTNVPEDRALEILLRAVSGYLAAPRPTLQRDASRFDRIVVMPTVAAPSAAVPAPVPAPARFTPPPGVTDDQNNDAGRVPPQPVAQPGARPPVFNPFPQPETQQPGAQGGVAPASPPASAQPTVTPRPSAPPGVSVPGVIIQPPPPPQQPPQNPPQQQP